ncbi:MAG: alpha-ketoglutarate-dependent dioxygenase AlkB family protein [Gammaproteobacteria bacterium]
MERLLRRVRERTGVPFNHVLVNRYRDGGDSMGLHADDEPELGEDPVVATLSLGAPRRFVLKPRRRHGGERHTLDLGRGSLVVMGGTCQRDYYHGVPRQPGLLGERMSLTFRKILTASPAPPTRVRPAGSGSMSLAASPNALYPRAEVEGNKASGIVAKDQPSP